MAAPVHPARFTPTRHFDTVNVLVVRTSNQMQLLSSQFAPVSLVFLALGLSAKAADAPPAFQKYCLGCHTGSTAQAGINITQLTAKDHLSTESFGQDYRQWQRIITAVETRHMPPKGMPQPDDTQRAEAVNWVRAGLKSYNAIHGGDPGQVTVRHLTSGEYAYAIHDLTGLDLDTGIDATTDSVGGEGFTNFGDVQFIQEAALERYLAAARKIADHAVIGAGPLTFFNQPGATGFEFSAIHRIKEIYERNGFRTVSGEGGFPFGLERYGKVFYTAWRYQHRRELGESNATLESIARREGIAPRFAQHVWKVLHTQNLHYPATEAVRRWNALPAKTDEAGIRAACTDLQKYVTTWPLWLFARGDEAVGGAGDESPLIISDKSLKVEPKHHFVFNRGLRGANVEKQPAAKGPATVYLNVESVMPKTAGKPVIIWRNATIAYPKKITDPKAVPTALKGTPFQDKVKLRDIVTPETAQALHFGESMDGTPVGPDDFAAAPGLSFQVPVPEGLRGFQLQVDAELGAARDHVFRIVITDRADGSSAGIPVRAMLGDPASRGFRNFKEGVLEWARLLPPNSNSEPTPADKDPVPDPFDSTYNVPEHDDFDTRVKYIRDDRFIYDNILSDQDRAAVDAAWNDLYYSFEYFDNYLDLLVKHFNLKLKTPHLSELTKADIDSLPPDAAKYIWPLKASFDQVQSAQAAAKQKRVADCLDFAALAWRRPLADTEKTALHNFYQQVMQEEKDHTKAVRAVLTRILVSPAFLYRTEESASASLKPLTQWELASRLSFFLWASIPDAELRQLAAAGTLSQPRNLQAQVKRMLVDPKSRRMSTEFFGQWLGFYHFDQHKGVDTGRFPEFTEEVRAAMYNESVSYFEHLIRQDRPVMEMVTGDYTFLNQTLAKYYSVKANLPASGETVKVDHERGGVLRLGALLTVTSAPLRTSPVKRGDWVLRRLLGTPVPPPPADAGSIPADDKMFGGLSLRDKLEAHKRNATCAACHVRIDPLGFPLERYDSTGRYRTHYADGKDVWDKGTTADKHEIDGVQGLLDYLKANGEQVCRTFAAKLLGYGLGRAVQASDQPLIDKLIGFGPEATFSQFAMETVLSRQFLNRAAPPGTTMAGNSRKAGSQ